MLPAAEPIARQLLRKPTPSDSGGGGGAQSTCFGKPPIRGRSNRATHVTSPNHFDTLSYPLIGNRNENDQNTQIKIIMSIESVLFFFSLQVDHYLKKEIGQVRK